VQLARGAIESGRDELLSLTPLAPHAPLPYNQSSACRIARISRSQRYHPDWVDRYGPRVDDLRLPDKPEARRALAEGIAADGYRLLEAVYAPGAPAWVREVPAVQTLRRV